MSKERELKYLILLGMHCKHPPSAHQSRMFCDSITGSFAWFYLCWQINC